MKERLIVAQMRTLISDNVTPLHDNKNILLDKIEKKTL